MCPVWVGLDQKITTSLRNLTICFVELVPRYLRRGEDAHVISAKSH